MRNLILTALLLSSLAPLCGQGFSGGFRAGLNFNTFSADQEMSADESVTYETFNRTTGFHIGATFAYGFTDLVGIKANLMYSQKGTQRIFTDTPSFFYIYSSEDDVQGTVNFGELDGEIDVVNSYIDIPLTVYYRFGPIEIEGGASMGLLVNSRSSGGLTYANSPIGRGEDVVFNIEGSYFTDEAGFNGVSVREINPIPGTGIFLPEVISTYYNNDNAESLYRRLDFGLVGGAGIFLNNGLFLGFRYQYGLTDKTRPDNDLSLVNETRVEGRESNEDDIDYNRSLQASVGFRF